ncbi:MAG: MBL fold metallo-hydrolase [Allomuricauda sp.]
MKLTTLEVKIDIGGKLETIHPVLIQTKDKNYLVDCGYEETFESLQHQLQLHGVSINDVTGVIITHDDIDHLGGLKPIKAHNNVTVYCSDIEKDSVSGTIKSERLVQAEASLDKIPAEYRTWALDFIAQLKGIQRYKVDHVLKGNDLFEREILIVNTPGHTKGHISLLFQKEGTLIAGDAMVIDDNGDLDIANPQFTLDLDSALISIEKIKSLKPKKIICYHGGIIEAEIDKKLDGLLQKYKAV